MSAILEPSIPKGKLTADDGFSKALKHVVSAKTLESVLQARQLRSGVAPSQYQPVTSTSADRIFDSVAAAKVSFAHVAMHMPRHWRDQAFAQIDALHEVSEWEEDDQPIAQSSFATFLRTLILLKIMKFPSLGMSPEGNVLAAWIAGTDRLMLEFVPANKVQWTVLQLIAGDMEPTSGTCTVKRLPELLAPHAPDRWFRA